MSLLQAILLAVVEGLTEFLPISSTGHMVIVTSWLGINADPFVKTYMVAIQLGAIASVVILYWKRFFQTFDFYIKLALGFCPAAVIGFLFNDAVDALLERVEVVAVTLILGGIVFLFLDSFFNKKADHQEPTYLVALVIGFFQCIAMIPGVSRSAATIIGGLTQRLTKTAAAEFSFFLAVPTMLAATAYKLFKYYRAGNGFSGDEIKLLTAGNVVAFAIAMLAIRWLMYALPKYGFRLFGYYRIALGLIILALVYSGSSLSVF